MNNKPDKQELTSLLGEEVIGLEPYKRNWKASTCFGSWIIKRVSNSLHLNWWLSVDRELRLNKFIDIPEILFQPGSCWMATPYIEGCPADYSSVPDAVKVVSTLAKFHKAGDGLITSPVLPRFSLYEKLRERLYLFYVALRKLPYSNLEPPLFELLSSHGMQFYLYGLKAWQKLKKMPLQEMCVKSYKLQTLTHRDLASHNWLVSKEKIWLIDFETADYDCQIGDLWQLLSRIMSEHAWDNLLLQKLMSKYEETRPLSGIERQLFYALSLFPNEFYRESLGLCYHKKGYSLDRSIDYLQQLVNQAKAWQDTVCDKI